MDSEDDIGSGNRINAHELASELGFHELPLPYDSKQKSAENQ